MWYREVNLIWFQVVHIQMQRNNSPLGWWDARICGWRMVFATWWWLAICLLAMSEVFVISSQVFTLVLACVYVCVRYIRCWQNIIIRLWSYVFAFDENRVALWAQRPWLNRPQHRIAAYASRVRGWANKQCNTAHSDAFRRSHVFVSVWVHMCNMMCARCVQVRDRCTKCERARAFAFVVWMLKCTPMQAKDVALWSCSAFGIIHNKNTTLSACIAYLIG